MSIVTIGDMASIREKHQNQKIVFCSGCFDLIHAGHVLFFGDCKQCGEILVVMVGSDKAIGRDKKDRRDQRPILNQHLRLAMVDALRLVDYCFLDDLVPPSEHPLNYIPKAFELLRPDVYAINSDTFDIPYREEVARKFGAELVMLPRWCPPEFEGVSTTKIIQKIQDPQEKGGEGA